MVMIDHVLIALINLREVQHQLFQVRVNTRHLGNERPEIGRDSHPSTCLTVLNDTAFPRWPSCETPATYRESPLDEPRRNRAGPAGFEATSRKIALGMPRLAGRGEKRRFFLNFEIFLPRFLLSLNNRA
jgi:hypothetical protein